MNLKIGKLTGNYLGEIVDGKKEYLQAIRQGDIHINQTKLWVMGYATDVESTGSVLHAKPTQK
jgi:phosphoserine phosphatase